MKPVFDLVEKVFREEGIDFYLIGAIARDVWMTGMHGIPIQRVTRDLDIAVLIPGNEAFTKLIAAFVRTGHFSTIRDNPHRLIFEEKYILDLLPFGADIETDGIVNIGEGGLVDISVEGFSEVYAEATKLIEFKEGYRFQVCTLPGIVLLKLIAFDDKPEIRMKDMKDIGFIIEHYFRLRTDEIAESHFDLWEIESFDEKRIGARVLGREIRLIIEKSGRLQKRIISILNTNSTDADTSRMARNMISGEIDSLEEAMNLLKEILTGLQD
jgi:predicted nucleotidyltransferase